MITQHVEDVKGLENQRQHSQAFPNKIDDVTSPNKHVQAEAMYDFILSYIIVSTGLDSCSHVTVLWASDWLKRFIVGIWLATIVSIS